MVGVNIADYPSFHKLLKAYLIFELKCLMSIDKSMNMKRI